MNRMMSLIFLTALSAPSLADPDLFGTWQATATPSDSDLNTRITIRLSFDQEGGIGMVYDFDDLTASLIGSLGETPPPEDLPPLQLSVYYDGTYEVVDDRIHVDLAVTALTVGGLEPVEGMVEWFRSWLRILAEAQGISQDDYPAFEKLALDEFRESLDVEEMKADMAFDLDTLGTYRIEGGVLTLTTEDPEDRFEEEVIVLRRVDPGTAVAPATWGQVKSRL